MKIVEAFPGKYLTARDLNGRLRRESWLVSKARRYLRLQLHVFTAYRNFIRRRINRKPAPPSRDPR